MTRNGGDPALDIPPGWSWASGREVFSFVTSGSRGWAKHYSPQGALFLRVGNLDHDTIAIDLSTVQRVSPPSMAEGMRTRVRQGDVLISITADLGMIAVAGDNLGEAYINQHICLARPAANLSPQYLAWYLTADSGGQRQFQTMRRGATKAGLGLDDVMSVRIPIAPLAEQRRIVAAIESHLTRLDAAIAALERAQRNLTRYRASALHAAVTGHLVPTEAALAQAEGFDYEPAPELLARILAGRLRRWEEAALAKLTAAGKPSKDGRWRARYLEPAVPDSEMLPELPEGWCWATVDQLLADGLANGRSVPTASRGCPVLRLTALKGDTIDLDEHKIGSWTIEEAAPFLIKRGDFLVSRGNGSIRLVGRGGLVERELAGPIAFPDTLIRVRVPEYAYLPRLLAMVWNSAAVRTQIEPRAKTTAGIWKINQTDLASILLPVPPIAEQIRLADEIVRQNSIAEACEDALERSLARASRLRQSILQLAFEGRLVDQDLKEEPAAMLLERIRAEMSLPAPARRRRPQRTDVVTQEPLL